MVHDHHLAHLLVLVVEGELLEQNVVKQHSQRPNVRLESVRFPFQDLRTEEVDLTNVNKVKLVFLELFLNHRHNPVIGYYVGVVADQNVLQLKVAEQLALAVQVLQPVADLNENLNYLCKAKTAILQFLFQVPLLIIRVNDLQLLLVLVKLLYRSHVWVWVF